MAKFSVNGYYYDFSSIELGLLGLKRLPEEIMAVTCGDGITRPDIEGTSQVPLGAGRGRYKADNLSIKMSLEAYAELLKSPSLPQDGYGNFDFPVVLLLQNQGSPEMKLEFPETSIIKQPFSFQQGDASLGLTVEFKTRYMLVNGRCLGAVRKS